MKWWLTKQKHLLRNLLAMAALLVPMGAATAHEWGGANLERFDNIDCLDSLDTLDTIDTIEKVESVEKAAPSAPRDSLYQRRTARLRSDWSRLIPNQTVMQFAGSIGAYSLGVGWHGHEDHWETEALFGYVPQANGSEHHYTITLKERYIPWHIGLSRSRRWEFDPLTAGLFANFIFGEGYWSHEPSKYTKGYYGFNTKLRWHIYVGQRWRYNIPSRHRKLNKSVTFYYEFSACDLHIVSSVPNSRVTLWDILSLALGLRFEIF